MQQCTIKSVTDFCREARASTKPFISSFEYGNTDITFQLEYKGVRYYKWVIRIWDGSRYKYFNMAPCMEEVYELISEEVLAGGVTNGTSNSRDT